MNDDPISDEVKIPAEVYSTKVIGNAVDKPKGPGTVLGDSATTG